MEKLTVLLTETDYRDVVGCLDICQEALIDADRRSEVYAFMKDVSLALMANSEDAEYDLVRDSVLAVIYDWFEVK